MIQSFIGWSSHIVGGEIYYDCLGNDQYLVTIKIYRDCNSSGASFDTPLMLGVFRRSDNTLFNTYSVNYPGSTRLPVEFNNPCVQPPNNICIEEAIYQETITLPSNPEGYKLVYERCCRGPGIINLANSEDEGLTLTANILGTNSGITCNSSPRFKSTPPLLLCNNEELVYNHSATDPDGDEIIYELCTPFHGGSEANPAPNPPNNPPYDEIVWEGGFNATQPFGATGPINLDPNTGQLTASPDLLGKFVVGVCANEYRDGNLISTTKRDFLFTVFNCEVSLASDIVPQEELQSFNSYCQGLTIEFENNSFGGTNYFWDFDVENDPNSTSTSFEPSYTFPSEGTYNVMLVVNPGWTCTDTSVKTFQVYEGLNVSFEPPPAQCITNNSFDFEGDGEYGPDTQFQWDFGDNANVTTADTENYSGVVFDTNGYIPITFAAFSDQCEGSYTDSIFVYKEPEINFGIKPDTQCAPFTAEFIDSSSSDAPLNYLWEFGDGSTSILPEPQHTYSNAGVYDVTLSISTNEGCIADLKLNKPSLIEVFPSPIADFSVDPQVTDIFNTEITFTDLSSDSYEHFYQLNDSVDTVQRNLSYHFIEGGYHYPYQVVTNEFGCTDTVSAEIYVEPQTTLYIPNAFTPNNDRTNEVFRPIIFDVTEYSFEIYNRWGEQIFKTNNRKAGWDGQIKNKNAPDGVYIWRIKFRNHKSIFEEHHGHFSLLR